MTLPLQRAITPPMAVHLPGVAAEPHSGPHYRRPPGKDVTHEDSGVLPRVGRWELVTRVTQGVWAEIHRARPTDADPARPAQYAVKLLRNDWKESDEVLELLRREAVVGRTVSNPHVVPVLAAAVYRQPCYLVMPWLEGMTLRQRLTTAGDWSVATALAIIRQSAMAVGALAAAGWLHGDLKPSNLLIGPNGHVTLLDLGYARRLDDPQSVVDRPLAGTFRYFAPEAIISTLRADVRSEIYSLGVMLYEMLCGAVPFSAKSLAELVTSQLRHSPPRLDLRAPHLPCGVVQLVHRMIAKDPLRRPQTAAELVEAIVRLEIEALAAENC